MSGSGTSVRHVVDDRPRTLWTRLYVRGMWLRRDKDAFRGAEHTLRNAEKLQRSNGDAPPTRWTRLRCRVTVAGEAGMQVWTVQPRRAEPRVRIVYFHGGGYVHPLTPDYWRLVRALTAVPAEVVVPAYPLAPGATVAEVLPRLVELAGAPSPLPTVLMGDSAGGALVFVVAAQLRDTGGPQPAGIVALSPWLDATLRDEEVPELEATDPMLDETGLRAAGRAWAGDRDPADSLVSPIDGTLSGLPPVDMLVGDRDILRPAVDRLLTKARDEDVTVDLLEVTEMFHVWMTRAIPEARRAQREIVRRVRRRLPGPRQRAARR